MHTWMHHPCHHVLKPYVFPKKIICCDCIICCEYCNLNLKDVNKHICDQGTKKDSLMKKRLQRTILDFYCIYYFMIIVD